VTTVYPPPVDTVTFRIGQRRTMWAWLGFGVANAVIAVPAFLNHWEGAYAYVFAALGLVVPLAALGRLAARTELTLDGATTRSLIRRRACRWDEIVRIGTKTSGGRSSSTDIVIYRQAGRPIKLYAPFTSTAPGGHDPQFDAAVSIITAYWSQRNGVAGPIQWPS
jgi:hypothetical protein